MKLAAVHVLIEWKEFMHGIFPYGESMWQELYKNRLKMYYFKSRA